MKLPQSSIARQRPSKAILLPGNFVAIVAAQAYAFGSSIGWLVLASVS
jgi:hypothetical protein